MAGKKVSEEAVLRSDEGKGFDLRAKQRGAGMFSVGASLTRTIRRMTYLDHKWLR